MGISITGVGLDRASRWSSLLAYIHHNHLRNLGYEASFRWFPIFGDSLMDPNAEIIEIFGHGVEQGFKDIAGIYLPQRIRGHVVLWSCYSDSFADELIRRGAKSVLGWHGKLWFRTWQIFVIEPYWTEFIIDMYDGDPLLAVKLFYSRVMADYRIAEVFHNSVYAYKV